MKAAPTKQPLALLAALLLAPLALLHADGTSGGSASGAPAENVQRIAVHFHLVTDLPMAKKGVEMTNWLTSGMIEKTVLPEVNRIWSVANVEWILSGVSTATTRSEGRAEVIAHLLKAERDGEGRADPQTVRKVTSILNLGREEPRVVHLYVIPYLGGTSQGVAIPRQKRVMVGQWTDKPSRGGRPPEKCLLVEVGEFKQGSFSRTVAHELGHILGLGHPAKNTPPFSRLMGGSRPGNELTEEEKATARKAASTLWPQSREP